MSTPIKILLGVVAAVALAAGGYFVALPMLTDDDTQDTALVLDADGGEDADAAVVPEGDEGDAVAADDQDAATADDDVAPEDGEAEVIDEVEDDTIPIGTPPTRDPFQPLRSSD